MTVLVLKKGREKSLRRRHPWLFSGAVEKLSGKAGAGDTVDIRDASGKALGRAAYSPKSQIRARVWTFDPSEEVDAAFFRRRIERALALREALPARRHTNALRLVHGESDGLPGLIGDRYADVLVAQFLAAGVERWRDPILDTLSELTAAEAIFERSDAEVRKLEALPARVGFARGNRNASRCPIVEYGLNFRVDVEQGQKTGFFLDQRENRRREQDHRDRELGARARGGAREPGREPVRRLESAIRAGRRVRATAHPARPGSEIPDGGPRSAQVRAGRSAGEERRARLQGHQPACLQAARPGRAARHLLVLGRGVGGALPVDRRRRRARRRRGREDRRALRRRRRPSRRARVPRGRIPERVAPGEVLSRTSKSGTDHVFRRSTRLAG